MDIEDYLEQKRALEAKKELLEAKERLKDDGDKRKKELEKEKRKIVLGDRPATDASKLPAERQPTESASPEHPDMARRLILFNVIILVLIVLVFGTLYFFFPLNGKEPAKETTSIGSSNSLTGGAVVDTQIETTTDNTTNHSATTTTPEPESQKYPGPDFDLSIEDKQLGKFNKDGKIGGEILVIEGSYYTEGVFYIENRDTQKIKCFIDRHIDVDENKDGRADLTDVDLDRFVYELEQNQKKEWDDALPGTFERGTYPGRGRVVATYDTRCYFCLDKFCNQYDKNGESTSKDKLRFEAKPGSASTGGNTSNTSS